MKEKERNKVPITALLMLKQKNRILLIRRKNVKYENKKYCFPGGHVEKGEEVKKAMIRETKEEIGITIEYDDLKLKHIVDRKVGDNAYIDFIFECTLWKGRPRILEKDKADKLKWFTIDETDEVVIPFMKDVLNNEEDMYISYGWEE